MEWDKLTIKQLKQCCKEAGLKGYSNLKKHQLVNLLSSPNNIRKFVPDDISDELWENWVKQAEEARSMSRMMPVFYLTEMNLGISGCWTAYKLREHGIDEDKIKNINFQLGSMAFGRSSPEQIWKNSINAVETILKEI